MPPVPHACVVPTLHTPWLAQAPHVQTPFAQVPVCVPQFPQARVAGPVQTGGGGLPGGVGFTELAVS
jgi:hypothetical protein